MKIFYAAATRTAINLDNMLWADFSDGDKQVELTMLNDQRIFVQGKNDIERLKDKLGLSSAPR